MSFRSELYQSLGTITDVPRPSSALSQLHSPLLRSDSQLLPPLSSRSKQKLRKKEEDAGEDRADFQDEKESKGEQMREGCQKQEWEQMNEAVKVLEDQSESISHLNNVRVRSPSCVAQFYSQRLRSTQSSVKQYLARAGLQFEQRIIHIEEVQQEARSREQVAILSPQQLFDLIQVRRSELKSQLANSVHLTPRTRRLKSNNPQTHAQAVNSVASRFVKLQNAQPTSLSQQRTSNARPLHLNSAAYQKSSANQFIAKISSDCIKQLKFRPQPRLPQCPPIASAKRFTFSKPCPRQPRIVRLELSQASTKEEILRQREQLCVELGVDVQRIIIKKFKNAIGFLLPQSKIYILYFSQRIYYGDWHDCKDGNAVQALPHSKRSFSWLYQGQFRNGAREGHGTLWTPQEVYSGQWKSGVREGRGTIWREREMLQVRYKHNNEQH